MMHLGHLALSGAALLVIEATAISPEGRISPKCVGLYDEATEAAMRNVINAAKSWSPISIALQFGHAGRKASTKTPWEGGEQIPDADPAGWSTVGPSSNPFRPQDSSPTELSKADLTQIKHQFVETARRAERIGIDGLEVHNAHGCLLHQFLSPLSNQRTNEYGGSLENRLRFPLEVFQAVRAEFHQDKPVWVRISATDWVENGWDVEQSIIYCRELEKLGCAAVHVSSGGLDPTQKITLSPGYQLQFSRAIKDAISIPVIGVGLITDSGQAETALQNGDADMIAIARAALYNPRWPWHAAAELGASVHCPPQYQRSQPRTVKNLFET